MGSRNTLQRPEAKLLVIALALALAPAALAVLTGGCGHRRAAPPPPATFASELADTELGPGDIFVVDVFGEKDLSGKYHVSAQGTIDYPLVGSVTVAGLTPPAVAKLLRERLSDGYLRSPYVSVFVEAYHSKKISVFGQVSKPGTFPYVNNMSIIEAITRAGGLTPIASKNNISVTRQENGESKRFTIPVEDIGEGRAANYVLRPGDVVFVPERIF